MKLLTLLATMLTIPVVSTAAEEAAQTLVDLEHAFARAVAEQGMGPGFTKFLAPDGYIFRPEPTLGRAWHATNTTPGRLQWEPELAVLSAAGDLGYTTGPWQFFADGQNSDAVANGHYFSVWQKQADGSWAVAADIGIPHEPQSLTGIRPVLRMMPAVTPVAVQTGSLTKHQSEADRLVELDRSAEWKLAATCRVYRVGRRPFAGHESIPTAWVQYGRGVSSKTLRAFVSSCGTLGCTVGIGRLVFPPESDKAPADASYLRVWECSGAEDWKLAAEIALPWPSKDP